MNSDPLSLWMPRTANGNASRSCSRPAETMRSPLVRTVIDSVHPVATSVASRGVVERAVVVAAVVADQVDLQEPGAGVVPVVPGLHGIADLSMLPGRVIDWPLVATRPVR
jgi:hypothetical protein